MAKSEGFPPIQSNSVHSSAWMASICAGEAPPRCATAIHQSPVNRSRAFFCSQAPAAPLQRPSASPSVLSRSPACMPLTPRLTNQPLTWKVATAFRRCRRPFWDRISRRSAPFFATRFTLAIIAACWPVCSMWQGTHRVRRLPRSSSLPKACGVR